ncbi:MAG TPA: adenosylmethionine decarboxylase [Herpetosiphonaceae bacterium]
MSAHEPAGRHLLVTLSGCPPALLDDEQSLRAVVAQAAAATGATVLQIIAHRFSPQGVTALALLAESHASLHTYPEAGLAFWDCFTCGSDCDPERSLEVLERSLRPATIAHQTVPRA